MTDDDDKLEEIADVFNTSKDIEAVLRQEFHDKWGTQKVNIPIVFVDWPTIWNVVLSEKPALMGEWSVPLQITDELTDTIGALAEPFVDYVNLSRRYIISHNINMYVTLEWLDMVFDPDKLTESYRVTDLAREDAKPETIELLETLISAYEKF